MHLNVNDGRFVTNSEGTFQLVKDAAISQSFPLRQEDVVEALKKILEQKNGDAQ
jgi:hypothetical protein